MATKKNTGTAVKVHNLYKSFKLPNEQYSGMKQKLINALKGIKGYETQEVLRDIDFEIRHGEFFGIVGRNGSGKSTLLKLIANIYAPNKGGVRVNGKLIPFIELGVGFNGELTGRENIYLNGAMLGFSRAEMEKKYDDIVGFSELERFMDQKLKNYSSGMQVRLAFSIAIQAEGDILLLDEVLAVGDEAFQRKCFNYFNELKRQKKTVILVTHDMGSVERFCSRAMFIEDGEIKLIGKPHEVAAAYSKSNDESYLRSQALIDQQKKEQAPFDILMLDQNGKEVTSVKHGETLTIRLRWTQPGVQSAGVALFCEGGEYVFGPNTYQDGYKLKSKNSLDYTFKVLLNEGRYFLKAGLNGVNDVDRIAFIDEGPHFTVSRDYTNEPRWGGIIKFDYTWK